MKKIVFIGGHHNSALVVAQILKQKGYQIYWFGHKHTMSGEKSLSLEYQEVVKAKIPFFEIKTGKFYRANFLVWFKIIYGFFQSLALLLKIKPQLIISFGGYLSFPPVIAAFILRKKILIHEQTVRAGLANRVLAPLAQKICLTWNSSAKFFPQKKTELVGLPLKKEFFTKTKKTTLFKNNLPVILITGGKQGSHVINKAIEGRLSALLEKYNLLHQTGGVLKTNDFDRLNQKKKDLPLKLKQRYFLQKFFFNEQMPQLLQGTDLVVSRAGAHIIYELAVLRKPAILIPIPWTYNNEQAANARWLEKNNLAIVLNQDCLNPHGLEAKIDKMIKNKNRLVKKQTFSLEKQAAQKMTRIIENLLKT